MPTIKWEIQTSDTPGAGTDARVYLSLVGSKGEVREKYLADTESINDWERGDLNTGSFQAPELGKLVRGTLRHDGGGAGSDWTVDFVNIVDEQGNVWVASVNDTLRRNQLARLVFRLSRSGLPTQFQEEDEPRTTLSRRLEPGLADFEIRQTALQRRDPAWTDEEELGVTPAVSTRPSADTAVRQLPKPQRGRRHSRPPSPQRTAPRLSSPPQRTPQRTASPGNPTTRERAGVVPGTGLLGRPDPGHDLPGQRAPQGINCPRASWTG
jgi:hypothetical protein